MNKESGATLLEVMMAMLVLSLVAVGIFGAFAFSRRLAWCTNCELAAVNLSQDIADQFREQPLSGWATGIYVNQGMSNPPARPGFPPQEKSELNMPPSFQRFLTNLGTARDFANHGDGRILVVEHPVDSNKNGQLDPAELIDLDGDGLTGIDFNNDGKVDLIRIRSKVRWTSPIAQ